MLAKIGILALGGALGTLLRYGSSGLAYRFAGTDFPWGTLFVNAAGSLLIGMSWALFERTAISPSWRLFLFVGLFGGFTTFSTFTLETMNLLKDHGLRQALLNILANNIIGLAAVVVGYILLKAVLIIR